MVEGHGLSQFMLVEYEVPADESSGIVLSSIEGGDSFLGQVATAYFDHWQSCRVVVDASGGAESLVDDVWVAKLRGCEVDEAELGRYVRRLVGLGVRFVLWSGEDYLGLPMVRTWREFVSSVEGQVAMQPADVWLRFVPK